MSNSPTIKLYTEDQMRKIFRLGYCTSTTDEINEDFTIDTFRPIQLPSDEEKREFTIVFFNWLHNNEYKYNPKFKMYQKFMINETLFFTIEELMIEFNKIQGGGDEK